MEIEFLGTGAGVPAKQRNVSSIALKLLDERNETWMFDCGEGTQQQILRTHVRPGKINKIFITHLHGDHIFGLPGFLSSRSFQGGDATPLTIYGPKGIKDFVMTSLRVSETHLSYKIEFVEITEGQVLFQDKQFKVSCLPLDHRIKCYGYRVEESDYPGELQVDKLKADNIPSGPIYGKIKNGETVSLPDGRKIDGKDYVGPAKKGRTVAILGDTRYTTNCIELGIDADVLVHESTFSKAEQKLAKNYYHSTSVDAAKVAKQAGSKKLLLTHISARYLGKMAEQLQSEAAEIFPNVKVVKDFDVIDVPFSKKQ